MSAKKQSYLGHLWRYISRHGLQFVLCLSSLVRLIGIGSECYWYDESFTALIADLPLQNALAAIAGDVHPPLFYAIEWLVARAMGTGPAAMRLPSAVFGLLAVYQTYLLCIAIGKKRAAVLAAAIVGIMPSMLYYSQEARSYALLTWLVLFAMTAIANRRWLRVMLSLVLLMYTHNLAFLYVVTLGLWAISRGGKQFLKYIPLSGAYAPWLIVAARQAASVGSGFWIIRHGAGQLFYQMAYTTLFVRLPEWLQMHAVIAVVAVSVIALWINRRDHRLWPVMAVAAFPPVIMFVVSALWRPVILERALLPSGACLMILWSCAIPKMSKRSKIQLASIAAPILVFSLAGFFIINRDDFALIADEIANRVEPGGVVYHTSIPSMIFLTRYMPGYEHYVLPNVGDLNQSLSEQTKAAMGLKQREVSVQDLARNGIQTIWLIRTLTPASSQDRLQDVEKILALYRPAESIRLVDTRFGKLDLVKVDLIARRDIVLPHQAIKPGGWP